MQRDAGEPPSSFWASASRPLLAAATAALPHCQVLRTHPSELEADGLPGFQGLRTTSCDVLTLLRPANHYAIDSLDGPVWRQLLARHLQMASLGEVPALSVTGRLELVPLEWTVLRFHATHAALWLATRTYAERKNYMPLKFLQTWAPTMAHQVRGGGQADFFFVVYASTADNAGGRVQARTPALINLPKPFRYTLFGHTHSEYDLTSSFLCIFVSVFRTDEAPEAWRLFTLLLEESTKEATLASIPGGKGAIVRAFNVDHPHCPYGPLRHWMDSQDCAPLWFLEYLRELQALKRVAIQRLAARGWHGDPRDITRKNELWHALAQGEAHIIRDTLFRLRRIHPQFSHGIIHDALVVHNSVPEDLVQCAFQGSIRALGFTRARLQRKSWDASMERCRLRLEETSYSPSAHIDVDKIFPRTP